MHKIKSPVWIFLGLMAWAQLTAHETELDDRPTFRGLKTDAPLIVDGILDEPFWQEAEIGTNFMDRRTQQFASQQTFVRIAYSKEDIYIAVEAFDDNIPELHATERREDRYPRGDDFVQIHLEPSHNHRTKYGFFSTPLGTRTDGVEGYSGSSWTFGWSAEWDLEAQILEDRWVFEMRIPYGIMNYSREDDQTWGFNVSRSSPSRDEFSWWSFNPTDSFRPHNFGHLTHMDLSDTTFDRNLEFSPYVSSVFELSGEEDTNFESGYDLSFRLSPSIITALTFNPDFGQVEADADTIELLDTERFLPERRPFFREGSELLRMEHRLYYTRRFTDIEAGAKVSGEYKDFNFTLLNLEGETVHGGTRDGNVSVFRALQNIGQKSHLGYYLNNSELDDGHSRVASTDGFFFLTDDFRFEFQASVADDERVREDGTVLKNSTDYLGYASLQYEKYPWFIDLSYDSITDQFDPDLALIFRRNIFGPKLLASYGHDSEESWYKSIWVFFDSALYRNEGDRTVLRDYEFFSEVIFPNDFGITASHEIDFHDPYDNTRTGLGISFNSTDFWELTEIGWARGEFQGTDYSEAILTKHYQPIDQFPVRWEYVARFEALPDGTEQTIWLNRVIADYFFNDDIWIKSSFQHQNDNIHNISVIFGWQIKRDLQWYMVFNSVEDKFFTEDSIFTKFVYTFAKRRFR